MRSVLAALAAATLAPLGGVHSAQLFARSLTQPSGAPQVLMADAFTSGTDLATRVPQSRGGSTWVQVAGTWSILTGQVRPPATGSANRLALYNSGVADAAMEATFVRASSSTLGLVLRDSGVTSPASAVRRLQATVTQAGVVTLAKVEGNSTTTLATTTVTLAATYRFRVQAVGAAIEVRVDGVTVLSVTLSAADQTTFGANTWQGLVATGAGSERIDDVLVTRWP
jgi:hypothetical protein